MSNHYLEGNYAPVADEATITDLRVSGTIPAELEGRFLRNGPNPVTAPDPAAYHWFSGDGMVHGLRLGGGRARWYRNRWVRSGSAAQALGEECPADRFEDRNLHGPNTNVIAHAGRTLAIVEGGGRPYELTDELDTVGPTDFDGTLDGGFSAHPKRDPRTGELHAVSYHWGWGDQVRYSVVDVAGRVRQQRFVATAGSPMVHDMSLTERYAIVYDMPVVFDLDAALAGSTMPYAWNDDSPARLGLVPRDGGDVRWVDVDPCFVFHPLNAYDDGDDVVIDVVHWHRAFDRDAGESLGSPGRTLRRWTVDVAGAKVRDELLDDHDQEFPRVDERVVGLRHRFGYSAASLPGADGTTHGGVLKHDTAARTTEVLDLGAGAGLNEAVFVPRADDADEDDGWLLCLTFDAADDTSRLVIHHAQALDEGPVATVHLPRRVPFGFHGNWIADD